MQDNAGDLPIHLQRMATRTVWRSCISSSQTPLSPRRPTFRWGGEFWSQFFLEGKKQLEIFFGKKRSNVQRFHVLFSCLSWFCCIFEIYCVTSCGFLYLGMFKADMLDVKPSNLQLVEKRDFFVWIKSIGINSVVVSTFSDTKKHHLPGEMIPFCMYICFNSDKGETITPTTTV